MAVATKPTTPPTSGRFFDRVRVGDRGDARLYRFRDTRKRWRTITVDRYAANLCRQHGTLAEVRYVCRIEASGVPHGAVVVTTVHLTRRELARALRAWRTAPRSA